MSTSPLIEPNLCFQERRRRILTAIPAIAGLTGHDPRSAWWIVALVVLQVGVAVLVAPLGLTWCVLAAATVGAVVAHALFVLVHEAVHGLVLRSRTGNLFWMFVSNAPFVLPSAASFRKYHLLHHQNLGDPRLDADVAADWEVRWVGNRPLRKLLWLLLFPVVYSLRPRNVRRGPFWDRLTTINTVVNLSFLCIVGWLGGAPACGYLAFSAYLAVGPHPLGGRWIQEHFELFAGQETNSYYGIGNMVSFDVGYHREHHDFCGVPWSRLRRLHQLARDWYQPDERGIRSWTGLLVTFVLDRRLGVDSRVLARRGPCVGIPDAKPVASGTAGPAACRVNLVDGRAAVDLPVVAAVAGDRNGTCAQG